MGGVDNDVVVDTEVILSEIVGVVDTEVVLSEVIVDNEVVDNEVVFAGVQ